MQVQTTLTGQEIKAQGVNQRGPWALNVATAADGTSFKTMDGQIAAQVAQLIGQPVTIEYELETRKGREEFPPDNVLKSIAMTNGQATAALQVQQPDGTTAVQPDVQAPTVNLAAEKNDHIIREVAVKATPSWMESLGFAQTGDIDAYEETTLRLAAYIKTGTFPPVRQS